MHRRTEGWASITWSHCFKVHFHRASARVSPSAQRRGAVGHARACLTEPLERRLLLSSGLIFVANSVNSGAIGEYNLDGTTVNASLVSGLNGATSIAVSGSDLFVTSFGGNTVGEYTTSGATVNASLISGLHGPTGIVVSGSDLFVTNVSNNTIGQYTTSGATLNASLISGLDGPEDIALSGSDLFVADFGNNSVGEYTTSGTTVSASLIPAGLDGADGVAVSGSDLFVANFSGGTIGEYSTSGATLNADLVSGLSGPEGIAVSGSDLFVVNEASDRVGQYTTSGATVNASLISGLSEPDGIAVLTGPVVTTSPTNQTLSAGATATFTAAASGFPTPTVQWQLSTNGGSTFTPISGATNTTYSFTAAAGQNGDEYEALFTNAAGSALTTAATLTVNYTPLVTTNPTSQSVAVGATATFTAAASGDPTPTLQWQLSTDDGNTFTDIASATNTTYSFTAVAGQGGDEYQAVFTNSQGSASTTAATLALPGPASVSGIVYNDKHDFGVKTRKDALMPDITLTLQRLKHHKPFGRAQSVTTNSKGDYSFTKLAAGNYRISEALPKGYTITQPSGGTYTITLSTGQNLTGENFGDHASRGRSRAVRFSDQPILSAAQTPNGFASLLGGDMAGADGNLESVWSLE